MEHIIFHDKRRRITSRFVILLVVVVILSVATATLADSVPEDLEQLDFAHGLFQRGIYDMAIAEYKNMIASFPQSTHLPEAYFGIAESLFSSELYEQAVAEYEHYLQTFPEGTKTAISKLRIGQALFFLEDYDKALQCLTDIKRRDLSRELAQLLYFYIGKVYKAQKDNDNAIKYFTKVSSISKKGAYTSAAFFESGEIFSEDADYEEAFSYYVKSYNSAIADEMRSQALYKQAEMRFSSKDYSAAAEIFEQVTAEYPNCNIVQDALANLFLSLFNLEEHRKVVAVYEDNYKLIAEDQRFFAIYYVVANSYAKLTEYDQSLLLLTKALSLKSLSADQKHKALLSKVNVLMERGQFTEVLDVLNTQLKDASSNLDQIAFMKAEAHYELQDFPAAFACYKQIVDDFPESIFADEALYGMGYTRYSAGKSREAIKLFLQYFQEGKDELKRRQALYRTLAMETELGLTKEAIEHCEIFLSTFEDSIFNENVMFQLGSLYSKEKNFEQAISVFQQFVCEFENSKKLQQAYFLLAYNSQLSNNVEQALEYYRKVTAGELLYPSLKNIAFIYLQREKDDQAAAEALSRIISEFEDNDLRIDVYLWLVRHYLATTKFGDALRILASAREKEGAENRKEELAYLQGEVYRSMGNCKKAIREYDIVLASTEDDTYSAASHINKGLCLVATEDYKGAESELETAIREYPEDNTVTMRARFELADLKKRTGSLNEACRFYMLVAILYQDSHYCPEALYRAGEIFEELNKHREARKAYQEIVDQYKISPQFERAQVKLREINEE